MPNWLKHQVEEKIMKLNDIKEYQVIKDYYIDDIKSHGYLLKHIKSGARIALLSNDDDNKVFSIGFRTPVSDDTGVPHIIEHSVLCGSEKYPLKDPFMELAKGSLNTFLNAITYPDKTVYPIASCNDKDFQNLMDVYLDAVFNPKIYKEENVFKQEGWHFELESPEAELKYNGVVYSEMKGVFSSVDSIVERYATHSLFPDVTYGFESGGNPDVIPSLTYEEFLDFHSRYYHPCNSYIYLYGDMDMVEKLVWLDKEYLSKYEKIDIDSEIKLQKPFDETRIEIAEYPISDGESEEDNTILSYNMVIGDVLDKKMYQAFVMIDYALMSMPGAPLKQAIIDAGIGKDVYCIGENNIRQPIISFIAKNANQGDLDKFKKVIEDTIGKILEEGVDKKSLEAGLNYLEFKYRENDFGRYPRGLLIGLDMLDSWLYDDNEPFMHIELLNTFKELRELLSTDYYDNLVREYLYKNPHSSLVVLVPKKGLGEQRDKELADKLANIKASLSAEEINKLVEDTQKLKEYQESESTQEELESIPLLSISDIGTEPRPIKVERKDICGIESLHHDYFTNGIGYLSLVFKNMNIPKDLVPYLGILMSTLSYMDTDKYSYAELSNEINTHTGSIVFDEVIHRKMDNSYLVTTEVNIKAFYNKFPKGFELLESILFNTKFDDYKRLLEIIREIKSKKQSSIIKSGDSAATLRGLSYYSESHDFKERYSGIAYFKFIEELEKNFQDRKEETAKRLELLTHYIFRPENMIISYTCDGDNYQGIENQISELRDKLYTDEITDKMLSDAGVSSEPYSFTPSILNEGFKTSSQIQYVVRVGNFATKGYEYTGSLNVLRVILSYEYLWRNVREMGGAYGCSANFGKLGDVIFSSYRDPQLDKTNQVYENIPEFLKNIDITDRDMTKFIIGTISGMDVPLTAADLGARSYAMYITGTTYEQLKEIRKQVLNTTVEDIRKAADIVESILSDGIIVVIGNENKIEKNKDMFEEVKNLIEN